MIDIEPSLPAVPIPQGPAIKALNLLLAAVLATMVALPVVQVIARICHSDIPEASIYTQHLTLWTGFLGAVLATIQGRHLSLSTAHLVPAGKPRLVAGVFGASVTAAVTALLAGGALDMVLKNRGQSSTLGGGIPAWYSEIVVPVTLGAIALTVIWRAPGRWWGRGISLAGCFATLTLALPWVRQHHNRAAFWPGATVIGVAFLLGTPVFVAMAGLAMLLYYGDLSYGNLTVIASVPTGMFRLVTNSTLPAVPLLTMAGFVMAAGGASQRLVALYRAWFGWMPGGMALMALGVCALFTAFTGASGVTILAVGGVIYPSLREEKYPEGFSLGLVTAAGSLGLLFPPSVPVLLYSVVAGADVKQLYLAGLVPGVLIILMVGVYAVTVGIECKAPRHPFEWKTARRAFVKAIPDLLLPVVIGAAFLLRVATTVEAAAIGALYAILIEVVFFRNLHPLRDLPRAMASGAALVGAVLILMGVALGLTEYLTLEQIPDALLDWVQAHVHSTWAFLLALNVILLVLGSVLEMYSAIVVLAPLIVPLGLAFHVDAVHLGVVFLANLELGFLLPPMGLNLFLSATRFNKPLPRLYRHSLPFLLIMTAGVLLVTYVPHFTTGVLKLFGLSGSG